MNLIKAIVCSFVGHDTKSSESIVNTYCSNNWLKPCKRCGAYVMHGGIYDVSITLSKKKAFKIKKEFEEETQALDKALAGRRESNV